MKTCDQFQAALLEYLYDALDPIQTRAVEAHVVDCAACQQALVEAQGQQQQLKRAAKATFAQVTFQKPTAITPLPEPAASTGWTRPAIMRWAVAASLMLGLAGLGGWVGFSYHQQTDRLARSELAYNELTKRLQEMDFGHAGDVRASDRYLGDQRDQLAKLPQKRLQQLRNAERDILGQPLHMLVMGPATLEAGAANRYQIRVRDQQARPTTAKIDAQVVAATTGHSRTVYHTSLVARDGACALLLPRDLPVDSASDLALLVDVHTTKGQPAELHERVPLTPRFYLTHLATDRRSYRPGETVRFHSLTLERSRLLPPHNELHLVYTLSRPHQAPVVIAEGRAQATDPAGESVTWSTETPVRGLGGGAIHLGAKAPEGEYTLTVRETDDRFAPQSRTFLVSRSPAHLSAAHDSAALANVTFFSEGGALVADVSNRVYFQARSKDDRPVNVQGHVVDEQGRTVVADVHAFTDPEHAEANLGLGRFRLTPKAGQRYEFVVDSTSGRGMHYPLPGVQTEGVAMAVTEATSDKGASFDVALYSGGRGRTLFVGAYCRGRLMAEEQVTAPKNDRTSVRLQPTSSVGGVYRITVFEVQPNDGPHPGLQAVAERLVYRRPVHDLKLTAEPTDPNKSNYAPGEPIRLRIGSFDSGSAIPALASITVSDARADGATEGRTLPSLAADFLLSRDIADPEQLEHADFLVSASPQAAQAVDLLLGVQGWRRFAEQDPAQFERKSHDHPREAERLLVSLGQWTPAHQPKVFNLDRQKLLDIYAAFDRRQKQIEAQIVRDERIKVEGGMTYLMWRGAVLQDRTKAADAYNAALGQVNRYRDVASRVLRRGLPLVALVFLAAGVMSLAFSIRRRYALYTSRLLAAGGAAVVLCGVTGMTWWHWSAAPPLAQLASTLPSVQVNLTNSATDAVTSDGNELKQRKMMPMVKVSPKGRLLSWPPQPQPVSRPPAPQPVAPPLPGPRPAAHKSPSETTGAGTAPVGDPAVQAFNNAALEMAHLILHPPVAPPQFVLQPYAYAHPKASGTSLPDRPETLYWDPAILLVGGQAAIKFDVPDSGAPLRVRIDAVTLDGRIGSATIIIPVRKAQSR